MPHKFALQVRRLQSFLYVIRIQKLSVVVLVIAKPIANVATSLLHKLSKQYAKMNNVDIFVFN